MICGTVWIWCSETVVPTSEVFTSSNADAVTLTAASVVVGPAGGAACAVRSSEAVEATASVTVVFGAGPASTA